MDVILQDGNSYVLRFDKGEEVLSVCQAFCEKNDIKAGWFSIIGATREVTLAWYDVDVKEYSNRVIEDKLEIDHVEGNVSLIDGKISLHAHGVFSDKDMGTFGGHVERMIIGGAGEMKLDKLKGEIVKKYDEGIGLNLMTKV